MPKQRDEEEVLLPQRTWTAKDERRYEHIKESGLERGQPEDRAEEIAARTVNKRRREEGRTQSKRTMGTGNPNRPPSQLTRDELYNRAEELHIKGRSRMGKDDLVWAVGSWPSRQGSRGRPGGLSFGSAFGLSSGLASRMILWRGFAAVPESNLSQAARPFYAGQCRF